MRVVDYARQNASKYRKTFWSQNFLMQILIKMHQNIVKCSKKLKFFFCKMQVFFVVCQKKCNTQKLKHPEKHKVLF